MGLENATYVSELVPTNPLSTDTKQQGDDHIRRIKEVLQSTFPNADKAFYFSGVSAKTANFTIASTDENKTFLVSTASGEVTGTLPTLGSGDAGWQCHFIKTNTDVTAFFIAPTSGTLQSGEVSGLAKCRRVIPGHKCTANWDGSSWYVSRVPSVPVGTCLEFHGASLPVGYEWPNGQTLTSASTKYPEFYSVNGNSGVTLDRCGRVPIGKDNMGESSNNRITAAGCGIDGDVLGAAGGAETHTLTTAEQAAHTHTGTTSSDGAHVHGISGDAAASAAAGGNFTSLSASGGGSFISIDSNGAHTHTMTTSSSGGGGAHNNVQPSIVVNEILVVE